MIRVRTTDVLETEFGELIQNIHINGTIKPSWYVTLGYIVEIKGIEFFNPLDCHYSFLLGQGSDEYRTCVGDKRYKLIEDWLVKKIIPKIQKTGYRTITSYKIKHMCEKAIGGYVSNETVKFILSFHKVPIATTRERYPINLTYHIK